MVCGEVSCWTFVGVSETLTLNLRVIVMSTSPRRRL